MMADVLGILLLVLTVYYLRFLWIVWRGLKHTVMPGEHDAPTVSVIVAARNEERNINSCLDALTKQDYDAALYEIIVVDDHSDDGTLASAMQYSNADGRPRVKVISIEGHDGKQGKPAAIARGIEAAEGEIILCTDADCITPERWIRSMTGCFEPTVVFVAGPVTERGGDNLLTGLQRLEFLGLLTSAAGLIGSASPIICNGANIAYRKSAFRQIQGYGRMTSSCDDETLMQRMLARRIGRVVFNRDAHATVATDTPSSFNEFFTQRTRWAAKRGRYDDPFILVRLIAVFAFFVTLFLVALASIMLPELRLPLLGVLVLKAIAEFTVLQTGARLFEMQFPLTYFVIAEIFHVPYIVIAASIGQVTSMRWKGRILER